MSQSGNCLDNTVAEWFSKTLKIEYLIIRRAEFHEPFRGYQRNWQAMTADNGKPDIVNDIEMFYSSEPLHSFLGYFNPNDYEKLTVKS
jgi:putative transposase